MKTTQLMTSQKKKKNDSHAQRVRAPHRPLRIRGPRRPQGERREAIRECGHGVRLQPLLADRRAHGAVHRRAVRGGVPGKIQRPADLSDLGKEQ